MTDLTGSDKKARKRSAIERGRRWTALVLVTSGWLGSFGLGLWAVLKYDPSKGEFAPQWVSLGYIFLIGVAIAASTARSRMRMTETIVGAFQVGQDIADDRWEATLKERAARHAGDRAKRRREAVGEHECYAEDEYDASGQA